MEKITVIRKEHFNAAHKLHNKNWSAEKNKAVFGKCNNENYHGHNYDLEVIVSGKIDYETGYLIDMKDLSRIIKSEIIDYLDHKNLNLDVDEFKDLNPTAENISIVIYNKMKLKLAPHLDLKIRLHETRKNIVEYPA